MSVRVPTTDEVDTGFTTFAWELEKSSPGAYGEGSGYENYHTVCEGFRRWLAEVERAAAEKAWDRCVGEMPIDPDWKNFYSDNNPYSAEAYRQERKNE